MIAELTDCTHIVTAEEHIYNGGFGSTVVDMLNDTGNSRFVKRLAIDFNGAYPTFHGNRDYMLEYYGLGDNAIMNAVFDLR